MKIRTLFPLLTLLVPVLVLKAETLVVLSGNSIQEKIDAASDGDIIAIFGGTYNQNITVNKKVRLAELAGQDVYITGSVTFTDLEETPPFQGFRVGGINIRGAKGLVIKDVDCDGALTLWGNGIPDVLVAGGSQGRIVQRAGSLVVNSASIQGNIEQTAGSLVVNSSAVAQNFAVSGESEKTIAFRSVIQGDCNWSGAEGYKGWFGYGEAGSFNTGGSNSKFIVVGAKMDVNQKRKPAIDLRSNGSHTTINNCVLVGTETPYGTSGQPHYMPTIRSLEVDGSGVIINNFINNTDKDGYDSPGVISIPKDSINYSIQNNCIHLAKSRVNRTAYFISAPFGVRAENNYFVCGSSAPRVATRGGAIATDSVLISGNSTDFFVEGDYYRLRADSPLRDLGTSALLYNDLDGSRNDIGPSGGSWYDPEGWTTENPVVISFDLSPDQVLGGVNDEVEISEIQAISAP
ncbi:hypothetical protein N8512_02070 [Akkermansiaceae bacterium]|nr:hypothetical protein [Akkermansiaceae bacterium]